MNRVRLWFASTVTLLAVLVAPPALAHDGTVLRGGIVAGALHPLSGLDHLLAMISVGLWGAFLGRPLVVALPIAFPLAMVVGAVLGMRSVPLPPIELGIACSVFALGLCVACAWRAPTWFALTIVGVFAVFHGYAHGRELPSAADPLGYSTGFVLATGLLHVAGIGFAGIAAHRGHIAFARAAGAAIAAAGTWFFYGALAS